MDVEVNKKAKFKSQHVMKQGTPAWSDNASITAAGGGKKLDAVYAFIDYELSVPWQARFIAASGNNGTLSNDQATAADAVAAGLTADKLAATLIPSTKDPGFFPALVFYKATNVLQKQLDVANSRIETLITNSGPGTAPVAAPLPSIVVVIPQATSAVPQAVRPAEPTSVPTPTPGSTLAGAPGSTTTTLPVTTSVASTSTSAVTTRP